MMTSDSRRKKIVAECRKQRFRKTFDQLKEEYDGGVTYDGANLPASKRPPRKFCSACGHSAHYNCIRCGTGYCSMECRDRHNATRCMKHTA
ncbi:hypothetical protein QR680_017133 [Steinernema hermaphroditum]|uniref:HIT-type domain-containing protein n=1 Tax=Steinernema hermaphroditum TaxID=289476 RepID=A0AA39HFV2_9BILA|nr:hypothetical protein QR680_017133 [Steinernema hermaphroditum]